MASHFDDEVTFWFNKSVNDSIYPTQSLYLSNGIDKKYRPIVVMRKMPSWSEGVAKKPESCALLLHHYLTYLASLIPLKRLKEGLALIVDSNHFLKHDCEHFKEFISYDNDCKFYQLYVYYLWSHKHNLQESLKKLPSGVQMVYVSCTAHLQRYILESQLPPQFGGTLTSLPDVLKTFVKNFEELEMFVTKELNKYMMMTEHVKYHINLTKNGKSGVESMGWMGGSYEMILWSHKSIKNSWDGKTLEECERIQQKFKNPQKFFSSIMYNPAFQLASDKLNFYISELMNFRNFHHRILHEIEHFLGISTPSPAFKSKSPSSYIVFNKTNTTFSADSDHHQSKSFTTATTTTATATPATTTTTATATAVAEKDMKLKNLSTPRPTRHKEDLAAKLTSMLSQSTPQLNADHSDQTSVSFLSVPEAKSEKIKADRYTQATLKRAKTQDLTLLADDSSDADSRRDNRRSDNDNSFSDFKKPTKSKANNKADSKKHLNENTLNPFKREEVRDSLRRSKASSQVRQESQDEETLNETLDEIEEIYSWYLGALNLFKTSSNGFCVKPTVSEVSNFLNNNPFPSLQATQKVIPDIKEDYFKNDINILIYRINCLRKVLRNVQYLKMFELKEILFWKEQYEEANSKTPLQTLPELSKIKTAIKNPRKDASSKHAKHEASDGKVVNSNRIFLIDQTPRKDKNSMKEAVELSPVKAKEAQTPTHTALSTHKTSPFMTPPHKTSPYKIPPQKTSPYKMPPHKTSPHKTPPNKVPLKKTHLNLDYIDLELEDFLSKFPKNTPSKKPAEEVSTREFLNYLKNDSPPTRDKGESYNLLTDDFSFKNPLYDSSWEDKREDVREPLEFQSMSRRDSLVMEQRIQQMESLLNNYDRENAFKKHKNQALTPMRHLLTNAMDLNHPVVTPPSYKSVVSDVPWKRGASEESGFWTLNSVESKFLNPR